MLASCEKHLRLVRFQKGQTISYHYGQWGLEEHQGQETNSDNFKLPHKLFENFVLVTDDSSGMKWVNDCKGTGFVPNILVHSAIRSVDSYAKVRAFVQSDVSKILPCIASRDIYVGDILYHNYGPGYWDSMMGNRRAEVEPEDLHDDEHGDDSESEGEVFEEKPTYRGLNLENLNAIEVSSDENAGEEELEVLSEADKPKRKFGKADKTAKQKKADKTAKSKKADKKKKSKKAAKTAKSKKAEKRVPRKNAPSQRRTVSQAQQHGSAKKKKDDDDEATENDSESSSSDSVDAGGMSPEEDDSQDPSYEPGQSP